jgi:hypothetical protein
MAIERQAVAREVRRLVRGLIEQHGLKEIDRYQWSAISYLLPFGPFGAGLCEPYASNHARATRKLVEEVQSRLAENPSWDWEGALSRWAVKQEVA